MLDFCNWRHRDAASDGGHADKEAAGTSGKKIGGSKSMHQIDHKLIHDQQFFKKKLAQINSGKRISDGSYENIEAIIPTRKLPWLDRNISYY